MLVALLIVIGAVVFGVVLVATARAQRQQSASRPMAVPGGGWVVLPGRFVPDRGATRLVPLDVLLAYGARRWSVGGYQRIGEAIAVGRRDRFDDWVAFQRHTAHYLQDADWRGPARESLAWQETTSGATTLREATLPEAPDRLVQVAERAGGEVYVVVFVYARYRARSLAAAVDVLDSYTDD